MLFNNWFIRLLYCTEFDSVVVPVVVPDSVVVPEVVPEVVPVVVPDPVVPVVVPVPVFVPGGSFIQSLSFLSFSLTKKIKGLGFSSRSSLHKERSQ